MSQPPPDPSDTLAVHDLRWADFLSTKQCPPVLGLAPLEEDERQAIREGVTQRLTRQPVIGRFDGLLVLLDKYPAALATWLACEAGEAYDDGEFWPRFEHLLGVTIPPLRRSEVARKFRFACASSMLNFTAPAETGGFIHVETFLHQAGLPVCQLAHFARLVRKVERTAGLPAPDDPSAGKELAEGLLEVVPLALVTLRRALRGGAGILTCEVALRLVFSGDYAGVSPRLREVLAREFAGPTQGPIRRSPRAPFLRLSSDLCALELVGPRQDPSLIGPGGLRWIIDGRRYPVASFDDFIYPLGQKESISAELQGLRDGQTFSRSFSILLDERRPPFLIFDAVTRLPARSSGESPVAVRAGRYWIVHRAAYDVSGATERILWPDGERAISLVALKPGARTALLNEVGTVAGAISTDALPCFLPAGERVTTDDGEMLYYAWERLPDIWLPGNDEWTLTATTNGRTAESTLAVDPDSTVGALTAYRPSGVDPVEDLTPGLHRISLTLNRRGKPQWLQTFLFWKGLVSVDENRFLTNAWPKNLVVNDCLGFRFAALEISHVDDQHRSHRLAFALDGLMQTFRWCRPGIYLESFTRKAGASIRPQPEQFGVTFSAGSDSARWLRIWRTGTDWAEVRVNGAPIQMFGGEAGRPFVDISLAHLALLHPHGGTITLLHRGFESTLARFSRPLAVLNAGRSFSVETKSLNFQVADAVEQARVRLHEVISSQAIQGDLVRLTPDSVISLTAEGLPTSTLDYIVGENGFRLSWSVPRTDWPEGIWCCELLLRRTQDADWQPISNGAGQRLPLQVDSLPATPPEGFRARAIWSNVSPQFPVGRLVEEGVELEPDDALGLLTELLPWRQLPYHPAVAKDFEWAGALSSWLCRRMSTVIHRADKAPALRLLHLASGTLGRRFFVDVPGLLALPANLYQSLVSDEPLMQSLIACGRLVASETVAAGVAAGQIELEYVDVLASFGNFNALLTKAAAGGLAPNDEFGDFDFARYWRQIGPLDASHRGSEWDPHAPALGRTHARWAAEQLAEAYEQVSQDPRMGVINGVFEKAAAFRLPVLGRAMVRLNNAYHSGGLEVHADNLLVPAAAEFASLLAFAARATAAGQFDFAVLLGFLEDQAGNRDLAQEAVSTLLTMAPALVGFHLLFWELIFRTHSPHA